MATTKERSVASSYNAALHRGPTRRLRAATPRRSVHRLRKRSSPLPTLVPMDVDGTLEGDVTEADTVSLAKKKSQVEQRKGSDSGVPGCFAPSSSQ